MTCRRRFLQARLFTPLILVRVTGASGIGAGVRLSQFLKLCRVCSEPSGSPGETHCSKNSDLGRWLTETSAGWQSSAGANSSVGHSVPPSVPKQQQLKLKPTSTGDSRTGETDPERLYAFSIWTSGSSRCAACCEALEGPCKKAPWRVLGKRKVFLPSYPGYGYL